MLGPLFLTACGTSVEIIDLNQLPAEARAKALKVSILRSPSPRGIPFDRLSSIEAISCKHERTAPPPTMGNALGQLQYKAHTLGANAVAGVSCTRTNIDPRSNCWQSIICTGTALKIKGAFRGGSGTLAASSGSGFFFNKHGNVLTNAHVVKACKSIRVRGDRNLIDARLVAIDTASDLAILQTGYAPPTFLSFIRNRQPKLSEDVVVLGYPLRGILSNEMHATSGDITALSGLGGNDRFLQVSAPVQPGNSGSPVIDGSGNVVGVIVSKLNAMAVAGSTGDIPQNVNFAIKADYVTKFLKSRGVDYTSLPALAPLDKPDLVEKTRAAAVPVLCNKT